MGDPDLATASDATLVVAIGRWRQDALAEAYRRHAGAVFALSRRLLADARSGSPISPPLRSRRPGWTTAPG